MSPERLREMIYTGSPGMIDHSLKIAITTLSLEKPRSRAQSPDAIPRIIAGLKNEDQLMHGAMKFAHQRSS